MCMFMSIRMSLVFIVYICHLFPPYQVRKNLIVLHENLGGQVSGWGTPTSYILSTPCNNRIFIFIVINSFNTTLVTYCHWMHSGRNIDEVMILFRKHEPTLRSLKVIISNTKITNFVQCNSFVSSACVWLWVSMLTSFVFILYICHLVPSYQVRKTLSCCMKDLWDQRSKWGTLTSYILTTLCDNEILICIVINSFITTLPTFRHWIHSGRNTCGIFIV